MNTVLVERSGAIARLTLNRPDLGNAIDMGLAKDLLAGVISVADDRSVRCVILTGAGRMFCVGGDIGGFADAGDEAGPFLHSLADKLHESVRVLSTMNKPLVTVVNGPAAGAGMSLALLGDIVLAGESAHFTAAYTGVGLTPDGGMSWLLPRLVGLRRAQDMILLNRRVGATEAAEIGLITRAVPDTELLAAADAIASKMARGPTSAFGSARALLHEGAIRTLSDQLDHEAGAIAAAGSSPHGREGVAAFLDRRPASFESADL